MKPKNLFERSWNCVYKIIGGETKFKNNFVFMYGDVSTARTNDDKITIQFCDISTLGGEGTLGRTGYLKGLPRLVQLANLEDPTIPFKDYLHNYAHELVHVALTKCQKNPNQPIVNCNNNLHCDMFSENLADILADLGLHIFDLECKNGLNINTMLITPYKHWEINSGKFKSGYTVTSELTQLMILAFQNENIDYNHLCLENKIGICMPISSESGIKINDFLYGIVFDNKHIEETWNRFMYNIIPYNEFIKKCNNLILNRHSINQIEIIQKKFDIMKDIATFANKKSKSNLQNGFISNQTNEKLRADFNNLWNKIIKELENDSLKHKSEGPSYDD